MMHRAPRVHRLAPLPRPHLRGERRVLLVPSRHQPRLQLRRRHRSLSSPNPPRSSHATKPSAPSQLSLMGLDHALSARALGERPSDRAIQGSMTKVLRELAMKGETLGLPVLLLEVGFPSSSRAWWDTSLGQGQLDLEEQERLYTSFAGALAKVRTETDRIRGTYLWRWEIEPGSGGARDRGFSPQGKPAEAVIETLYR